VDADVGIVEQECDEQVISNTPDAQRLLYGIRTQYSTKIKKVSDAVDRREGDKNWREAWS